MDAIREDQLGRALTWSLIGHGAIAFVILVKSLVFPGNPVFIAPALRVDLVGLPDILKKDLAKVPKALPKEDLKEKLAEAAKEAKKINPVPEDAAKPDEMVLNPKKTEKKTAEDDKKKEKEKEKKIDSALAKIRALERLKDKSDEARPEEDDAIVIKGNQVSKGTALSGDAKEKAEAGYYDVIRDHVAEYWALPEWLRRQKLTAQIQIRIDPAGRILSSKFVKTSGNPQFDEAILGTLKDAEPLPRPPKELTSSLADDGIVFGFPL
ncbi:MAG: TonB family protein [Bdellovibrionales bacterium]|nr:TonB family protein [Bdellovibrionales bacterium]